MGVEGYTRIYIEEELAPNSTSKNPPPELLHSQKPLYALEDNMHIIKTKPEKVNTIRKFKKMIAEHHMVRMNNRTLPVSKYISVFDKKPHKIKSAIEHVGRDKGIAPWPKPENGIIFDESQPDAVLDVFLPENWRQFCSTRKLVRRHLYPLIFNTLIDPAYIQLKPQHFIVLQSIPGQWTDERSYNMDLYKDETANTPAGVMMDVGGVPTVRVLRKRGPVTKEEEVRDPDVYNRVWIFEGRTMTDGRPFMHYEEWADAKNEILEADLAICYYDHFFPNENCLVYGNDGDFVPILLAYASERKEGSGWRNNMWLRMPNRRSSINELKRKERAAKRKSGVILSDVELVEEQQYNARKAAFELKNKTRKYVDRGSNRELYYDMNQMWTQVHEYNKWGAAGVQNSVLTLIALMIMAGTDFFKNMLPGVGTSTLDNCVWQEFLNNPGTYRHLFQLSKQLDPDTRAIREPCIDRELFIEFCNAIYLRAWRKFRIKKETEALEKRKKKTGVAVPETMRLVKASLVSREVRRQDSLTKSINIATRNLKNLKPSVRGYATKRKKLVSGIQKKKKARTDPKLISKNTLRTRDELLVKCAQLDYAILYWYNDYRDQTFPNPLRAVNGIPVYGYQSDPDQPKKAIVAPAVVQQRPEPVPDVYAKWHVVERRRRANENRIARNNAAQTVRATRLPSQDVPRRTISAAQRLNLLK